VYILCKIDGFEAGVSCIGDNRKQMTDFELWDYLVKNFEERYDAYRCSEDHNSAAPEPRESALWEVEISGFDMEFDEEVSTVRVCSSHDIAVEEAVDLLWSDSCGAFYETDHIFDDAVTDLAERNGAMKKLEEMRLTLRNIVQCSSCYESMPENSPFYAQGGRQKVLVQPSHEVITKKRILGSRRDDGAK
jgi:hypothetical protein